MMQDVAYDLHSTFIIFYTSLKHYFFTGLYLYSLTYFLSIEKSNAVIMLQMLLHFLSSNIVQHAILFCYLKQL